jgi:hypothetical protein
VEIITLFGNYVPPEDSVAEFYMAMYSAYDRLPEYWKIRVPNLLVYLTTLPKDEFLHGITPCDHFLFFYWAESMETNQGTLEYLFLSYFINMFIRKYPQIEAVIEEQAKAGIQFFEGTAGYSFMREVNFLDGFRHTFPQFMYRKDSLIPKLRDFMIRVDQAVKHGTIDTPILQ